MKPHNRTGPHKVVEVVVSPMRVVSTVLTVAAFIGLIVGIANWVFVAEIRHNTVVHQEAHLGKLDIVVESLNSQQQFERKLWGDSYEQRIGEILAKENRVE